MKVTNAKVSLMACAATQPENVFLVNIGTEYVHVLRQMRAKRSDEGMQELSESIKVVGQMHPGIVVALPEEAAKVYLKRINEMWGTSYRIAQFKPVFIKEAKCDMWLFVVAGHRRLHAVKQAGLTKFYCYIRMETNFSQALQLQFQENLHEEVPSDDEARFLTLFWREEKGEKPTLSLASFAKRLGKQPETIRRAVRFTSLPVKLQKLMQPSKEFKKGVAFGILCEIARLQEAREAKGKGYSDNDLLLLTYSAVAQQKTVKATALWVNEQIRELEGQSTMFELSPSEAAVAAKKTVSTGLEQTVQAGRQHIATVARFHESGAVEKIASDSAVNAVRGTLELITTTAPEVIQGLSGSRRSRQAREEIQRVARRA